MVQTPCTSRDACCSRRASLGWNRKLRPVSANLANYAVFASWVSDSVPHGLGTAEAGPPGPGISQTVTSPVSTHLFVATGTAPDAAPVRRASQRPAAARAVEAARYHPPRLYGGGSLEAVGESQSAQFHPQLRQPLLGHPPTGQRLGSLYQCNLAGPCWHSACPEPGLDCYFRGLIGLTGCRMMGFTKHRYSPARHY